MLTILSYKTDRHFMAYHMEAYKQINVEPGDSLEEIILINKITGRLLFQIDLTNYRYFFSDTDDPHLLARKLGLYVLNFGLYDISKRQLHYILNSLKLPVTQIDKKALTGDELVIIKSNLNYGGRIERELTSLQQRQLRIDCDFSDIPLYSDYQVVKSAEVPSHLWIHPGLVIEKFICNDEESYIRIRKCFDKYVMIKFIVPGYKVKKVDLSISRETFYLDKNSIYNMADEKYRDVIVKANIFFEDQNLDIGAIDIVTDNNGLNYIIDINDTSYWGNPSWGPGSESKTLAHLRSGNYNTSYLIRKTLYTVLIMAKQIVKK